MVSGKQILKDQGEENKMTDNIDVGTRVRIKGSSSKYSGEEATILRLGLSGVTSITDLSRANSWVVQVEGRQEEVEITEHELEPIKQTPASDGNN
jgi:hypothetical protein